MQLVKNLLSFEEKRSFFYTLGLMLGISISMHYWFSNKGDLLFSLVMGLATSCFIGLGYLFLAPTKDASDREVAIKNGLSIVICISWITWLILKVFWGI